MTIRTLAAASLVASVMACADINSQTHSYGTLEEARLAGATEQGWIPGGLPAGSHEIRVAYVPGGSQRWGLFNFPPDQGEHLKALLAPEEVDLDGIRVDIPARIEWWPVALRGTLNGEQLGQTGLRAYRTADGSLFMAVNWNQGRAYYWHNTEG